MTQCDKQFFKHSDLFFSGKFILRKKLKIWLPFKNKFQHRIKIGLEYLKITFGGKQDILVIRMYFRQCIL